MLYLSIQKIPNQLVNFIQMWIVTADSTYSFNSSKEDKQNHPAQVAWQRLSTSSSYGIQGIFKAYTEDENNYSGETTENYDGK